MIQTAEEILEKNEYLVRVETDSSLIKSPYIRAMIEFAKFHCEAQAKEIVDKCLINRDPTGEGELSESCSDKSFEGDLGYEDYIPVNYTINKESILNAYPLNNIK